MRMGSHRKYFQILKYMLDTASLKWGPDGMQRYHLHSSGCVPAQGLSPFWRWPLHFGRSQSIPPLLAPIVTRRGEKRQNAIQNTLHIHEIFIFKQLSIVILQLQTQAHFAKVNKHHLHHQNAQPCLLGAFQVAVLRFFGSLPKRLLAQALISLRSSPTR